MKYKTFKMGGVHPDDHKIARDVAIQRFPIPAKVAISMAQHLGAPATPAVEKGDKVKVSVRFRGREMELSHLGLKILDKFASKLEDVCIVEKPAKKEGRSMTMVLGPKKA